MASMLLGCLFKNPSLMTNPSYPLDKLDFAPVPFHRILYVCAYNIYQTGCSDISEVEIDNYIEKYETQKEVLDDSNFGEFVETVKELSVLDNFDFYYTCVRKFSLLRELKEDGIDIKSYYDDSENTDKAEKMLDRWTIQDILSDIESKNYKLRNKYDVNYVREEMKAGEETEELIKFFEVEPAFGAMLQSPYLTTLWNGWSQGHLILRGGASGVGKSSLFIGDICNVGALEMWDDKVGDFIVNSNYQSPSLYIHTEMDTRTEINPKFLACISGVNVRSITEGILTKEEKLRVLKAGDILLKSGITLTYMPDFTCKSIERKVKELVQNEGIKYCIFDYLELQSALTAEYKSMTNISAREDMVLKNASAELKEMAEEYNVGIMTGCQLNDGWKEKPWVDESCLSGSKAMKNKLDGGSIITPTSYAKKDMKILEGQFEAKRKGFGKDRIAIPNTCETIFKSRFGAYGDQRLRLWSYVDRGTCRRYDYGVWDDNNERVPIKKTEIVTGDF